MPKLDVYNLEKNKVGELELSDEVFGAEVKEHLFWAVVRQQRASQRTGSKATKTRSQVSGGGAKPWRQKGTGRARAGSSRQPNWVGGGNVFAHTPRDYSYQLPKKVRRAAMRSALSLRLQQGNLLVVDGFEMAEPKTKKLTEVLSKLDLTKALLVDEKNRVLKLSARNLPHVAFIPVEGIGLLDILRYDQLLLTRAAAEKLDGAYKR